MNSKVCWKKIIRKKKEEIEANAFSDNLTGDNLTDEKVNNAAKEVDEKSSLIHSKEIEIDMLANNLTVLY